MITRNISRPPLGPRATSRHATTLGSKPVGPINWLRLECNPLPPSSWSPGSCVRRLRSNTLELHRCGYELHNWGGKREHHIIGMLGIQRSSRQIMISHLFLFFFVIVVICSLFFPYLISVRIEAIRKSQAANRGCLAIIAEVDSCQRLQCTSVRSHPCS